MSPISRHAVVECHVWHLCAEGDGPNRSPIRRSAPGAWKLILAVFLGLVVTGTTKRHETRATCHLGAVSWLGGVALLQINASFETVEVVWLSKFVLRAKPSGAHMQGVSCPISERVAVHGGVKHIRVRRGFAKPRGTAARARGAEDVCKSKNDADVKISGSTMF